MWAQQLCCLIWQESLFVTLSCCLFKFFLQLFQTRYMFSWWDDFTWLDGITNDQLVWRLLKELGLFYRLVKWLAILHNLKLLGLLRFGFQVLICKGNQRNETGSSTWKTLSLFLLFVLRWSWSLLARQGKRVAPILREGPSLCHHKSLLTWSNHMRNIVLALLFDVIIG